MIECSIDVLLLEIYEYLLNHEIMNVMCTSKSMYRKIPFYEILDFMNYRVHPLVINKFDQYCMLCNQGLIILDDESYVINCDHE